MRMRSWTGLDMHFDKSCLNFNIGHMKILAQLMPNKLYCINELCSLKSRNTVMCIDLCLIMFLHTQTQVMCQ